MYVVMRRVAHVVLTVVRPHQLLSQLHAIANTQLRCLSCSSAVVPVACHRQHSTSLLVVFMAGGCHFQMTTQAMIPQGR